LLLRSGNASISTVMRRLLTGYAVSYNRRQRRNGHLFQNRFKSILCQGDIYLKELVAYIHLNPLRARMVADLKELAKYPYGGHSVLMGKQKRNFQDVDYVLRLFGEKAAAARRNYREYVRKRMGLGQRPELVGGGLLRSSGGWGVLKAISKARIHLKGDERNKRKQTAGYRSTGGEPFGSAGRKIGSGYEFKLNKVRNEFFHDRPLPPHPHPPSNLFIVLTGSNPVPSTDIY
jgi:hypothetical protein